jgi:hypothetical protein
VVLLGELTAEAIVLGSVASFGFIALTGLGIYGIYRMYQHYYRVEVQVLDYEAQHEPVRDSQV